MNGEGEPCPCELEHPQEAPGPVADCETVIRFIPHDIWLYNDERGQRSLNSKAFGKDELSGSVGKKSVSVLRAEKTSPDEILRRGRCINKEESWSDDPLIAVASAQKLRNMVNGSGRREICVYADPTDATRDILGPCPTHASLLRAKPPLDPKLQRAEWSRLRLELAAQFVNIRHCSGKRL